MLWFWEDQQCRKLWESSMQALATFINTLFKLLRSNIISQHRSMHVSLLLENRSNLSKK